MSGSQLTVSIIFNYLHLSWYTHLTFRFLEFRFDPYVAFNLGSDSFHTYCFFHYTQSWMLLLGSFVPEISISPHQESSEGVSCWLSLQRPCAFMLEKPLWMLNGLYCLYSESLVCFPPLKLRQMAGQWKLNLNFASEYLQGLGCSLFQHLFFY